MPRLKSKQWAGKIRENYLWKHKNIELNYSLEMKIKLNLSICFFSVSIDRRGWRDGLALNWVSFHWLFFHPSRKSREKVQLKTETQELKLKTKISNQKVDFSFINAEKNLISLIKINRWDFPFFYSSKFRVNCLLTFDSCSTSKARILWRTNLTQLSSKLFRFLVIFFKLSWSQNSIKLLCKKNRALTNNPEDFIWRVSMHIFIDSTNLNKTFFPSRNRFAIVVVVWL